MTLAGSGIPASLALARFASTLLFGIGPADPAAIAAVLGIVACVGMVAAHLPARRAAKVDPVRALAAE
jgi:ABC-type antimicrobial peptide transport system permease subunit